MKTLIAQKFQSDPRVKKAKKLLSQALMDHQKSLTGVKEPQKRLKVSYEKLLAEFAQLRGQSLYYPYLSSGIGKGALVELGDGSVKYDFITGIGVHYFGHSHPGIMEANISASLEDTVMQGNLQQTSTSVEVMKRLVKLAGAPLKHCFFSSSGAMANENALKIIFQKKSPANRLLAFKRCFAGRSLVTAQITDKLENRKGLPEVLKVDYIPFFDPKHPQESTEQAVQALGEFLKLYPHQHAGMFFELVQGEGGFYEGNRNFFMSLMKILKEEKIAVVIDEIQTFGRTPKPFAFQYYELDSYVDVVTIGKMLHVCATFFTEEFKPEPGLLSQTFTASSSAFHTALFITEYFKKSKLFGANGKITVYSKYFRDQLQKLHDNYPDWIQGPFGVGVMIGFTVFDGSAEKTKIFIQELFKSGVVSFLAGSHPSRVRFLVPIAVVTKKDIQNVCRIIEQTLNEVAKRIKSHH